MTDAKIIFIAFAMEDEGSRNLFTGQRLNTSTPFSFTDMSVKEKYETGWKDKVRARVRRSDGVIALLSASTASATGQLWEIACAVEEGKPLQGIWLGDHRTKPAAMGTAPCRIWTWDNVANFISGL